MVNLWDFFTRKTQGWHHIHKLTTTRGTLPALPGISNFYLIENFVKEHHTNETTLQTILMCRGIQNGTIHITILSQGRKHLLANPGKSVVGIVCLGKTVLSVVWAAEAKL